MSEPRRGSAQIRTMHPTHPTHPTPEPAGTTAAQRPAGLWLALLAGPIALSANSPTLVLDKIAAGLGTSVATATWIATTFGWGVVVGTPLAAGLLRRYGMRPALLASAALILVGSCLELVGPALPELLVGRAAQAIGSAGAFTIAMNLAGTTRRTGLIMTGVGVFGAVGPLTGALVADHWSWHGAVALSALSLPAVPAIARALRDDRPERQAVPADLPGLVLVLATVSALVFIPRFPVLATIGLGILLAVLALHVRSTPDGFLPLELLRTPAFVLAGVLALALSTSYFTLLYVFPRMLGDDAGWTIDRIGVAQMLALLLGSIAAWVLAFVAARLVPRTIFVILVCAGVLAPALAGFTAWLPLVLTVPAIAVFGAVAGQATLTVSAAGAVARHHRATAISLVNLCYLLGGAFGPAVAAVIAYR
ncbi:MAG TPA: MFS transporter [Streptosporangiaceae bacterium]|nr:MFS transporter [Streptosporangiaceae bacterium]